MKPSGFNIEFKYICDKCGCEYWLTTKQVKTPGFKIACCHTLNPTTIKNIEVKLEFAKEKNDNDLITKAYNNLKQYGYSEEEVRNFQETIGCTTAIDLVQKFLKVQRC